MPNDGGPQPAQAYPPGYDGSTYYDRPSLKHAPFNNVVVGAYVFLAGMAGASQLIGTLMKRGRVRGSDRAVRNGRWLSLAAPTIGSVLLVYDLHTPQRFYNMLRIFRRTSPMSIGTWILMSFTGSSIATWAGDVVGRIPGLRWLRLVGGVAELPGAVSGAALGTYTAALLSATSTPLWAAAPRALAVRFGASSIASACAALSLAERHGAERSTAERLRGEGQGVERWGANHRIARDLDTVALAALGVELAASLVCRHRWRTLGLESADNAAPGAALMKFGADLIGTALPIVLHASALAGSAESSRRGSTLASLATLAGSLCLRIGVMSAGDASASRPHESLRFASPKNLPR